MIRGVQAHQIMLFSSFQAPIPEQNPIKSEKKQQKPGNLLRL